MNSKIADKHFTLTLQMKIQGMPGMLKSIPIVWLKQSTLDISLYKLFVLKQAKE